MNIEKVKLKDGSEYPLGGSWNNLTDKPFYENTTEIASMPETELTFAYQKDINRYVASSENSSDIVDKWSGDWNKATVVFDGISYIVSKNTFNGMSFIGDFWRIEAGFPVTGEPFAMTPENSALTIVSFTDATPEDPDNAPNVTHTISILLIKDTHKKLDDAYQHQPDWNNTNQNSASCVKNRPFGLNCEDGAIIVDKDVVWSATDGVLIAGDNIASLYYAEKIILEINGEKYISSEIYRGDDVPVGVSEILFSDVDGKASFHGMSDTKNLYGVFGAFMLFPVSESIFADGETIHIKATVFGSRKPIDNKYLSFMDKVSSDIVNSLIKFAYSESKGNWISDAKEISEDIFNKADTSNKPTLITIDNIEYRLRYNGSTTEGIRKFIYYGNSHLYNPGYSDTGEPYCLLFVRVDSNGSTQYGILLLIAGDAPSDTSITQTHYIKLKFENAQDTYTINRDYLPTLPEFDLTAMGLPEIPMDGTAVSVSCDTTGLITALNKGAVKLISKVKFSDTVTHDYTCIANAGFTGNEYNCTMCGVISGVPMMISVVATSSKISAYITRLAVPTTTTTETGTT